MVLDITNEDGTKSKNVVTGIEPDTLNRMPFNIDKKAHQIDWHDLYQKLEQQIQDPNRINQAQSYRSHLVIALNRLVPQTFEEFPDLKKEAANYYSQRIEAHLRNPVQFLTFSRYLKELDPPKLRAILANYPDIGDLILASHSRFRKLTSEQTDPNDRGQTYELIEAMATNAKIVFPQDPRFQELTDNELQAIENHLFKQGTRPDLLRLLSKLASLRFSYPTLFEKYNMTPKQWEEVESDIDKIDNPTVLTMKASYLALAKIVAAENIGWTDQGIRLTLPMNFSSTIPDLPETRQY